MPLAAVPWPIKIDVYLAMHALVHAPPVTFFEQVKIIQGCPVCAANIAIVAVQVPTLKVVLPAQPARENRSATMLVIILMRDPRPELDFMCRGWSYHRRSKTGSAQEQNYRA
jgi:hypothetical protein